MQDLYVYRLVSYQIMIYFLVIFATYVFTHDRVHNYTDEVTGCQYLYTAGSPLTPREDGAGNHFGCYPAVGRAL